MEMLNAVGNNIIHIYQNIKLSKNLINKRGIECLSLYRHIRQQKLFELVAILPVNTNKFSMLNIQCFSLIFIRRFGKSQSHYD